MSQTERFVVKKESGSQWARVVDTATGMQIARYNVMPRKRSLRDGWEDAEKHAKRLNAVSVSSSLLLDREEAGGQIAEHHSGNLAVPLLTTENLSEAVKPCPFCGAEPHVETYAVQCMNPFCEAQPFTASQSQAEAIAGWNRRPGDQQ